MSGRRMLPAIFMVAALVGCSDSLEPVPQATVRLTKPAPGELVNENVAPETSVRFEWIWLNSITPSRATVRVDGLPVCSGTDSCEAELANPVGKHSAIVSPDNNGQPSPPETFTIRSDLEIYKVRLIAPVEGVEYRVDYPIPCVAERDNSRAYSPISTPLLDGKEGILCSSGQLLQSSAAGDNPVVLSMGEHILVWRDSVPGRFVAADTVRFTVVPRPHQIYATLIMSGGVRDFAIWDAENTDPAKITWLTQTRTTHPHELIWASLSPDGTNLAFTLYDGATQCRELFVVILPDRQLASRRLLSGDNCASGNVRSSYWSPDGSWLAYVGTNVPAHPLDPVIYSVKADGRDRSLVRTWSCDDQLTQSPCFWGVVPEVIIDPSNGVIVTTIFELLTNSGVATTGRYVGARINGEVARFFEDLEVSDPQAILPWLYEISPDGEWVSAYPINKPIHLFRTNGTGEFRRLESADGRWPFTCDGEWWYYVPRQRSSQLRRIRSDGTGDEVVIDFIAKPGVVGIETPRCLHQQ